MRDRELRDVCANYDIGYLIYGYASRLRGAHGVTVLWRAVGYIKIRPFGLYKGSSDGRQQNLRQGPCI
jgi:hypothetical protein